MTRKSNFFSAVTTFFLLSTDATELLFYFQLIKIALPLEQNYVRRGKMSLQMSKTMHKAS